ncbi:MAG: c-type cytochrome [Burkholderiales bacterium]
MTFRPALVAAALASGAVLAAEPPPKADLAKGQQVASQVCAACHGPDGNSIGPANPKLAGQIPEYLAKQLVNFRPGKGDKAAERPNNVMAAFAAALSAEQMRDVAAFYASQKLIPEKARNKSTIELGRQIFRAGIADKNVPACAGCHGPAGAGIAIQYPVLAGQYAAYIEAQLKAFRSGERANDPNRMMRTTASRLSDLEIRAVADYVAGLR